ncbi:DEAD/DEAH box helicase family protein [Allonocardiopsis opalescens]|uniref:Type III restriction/modification enzyme restriction subunit n=1 Tax=Allonocardiopsis opalescens TaxID=1144618 RepID=A0A2T0Q0Q7_9ACTN|nr:DEAD/DEAH box helicase family protein [Allonocardiopsis opalescens]PRX97364.1 type III restriction/modification enzyme restriction subunit [Allonocardiopsis opalescens]
MSASGAAGGFAGCAWPGELRDYQAAALDRLAERWAGGHRRAWIVLPPGAGKTLVGLEAARRLGRRTVVLVPNTAIQGQWLRQWGAFTPATVRAGTSRELDAEVTVLTYQALAVFEPEEEVSEEGAEDGPVRPARRSGLLHRLHPNGAELVAALRGAGPITLLLDECHHLLQVWGRLVSEVVRGLPDAHVVGLTGTPPPSLSTEQAALVRSLFGTPIVGASIPALVRDGHLAPFAELAWLASPTPVERDYIAAEATRFAELRTDLMRPDFATTPFPQWLDRRFVDRPVGSGDDDGSGGRRLDWDRFAHAEPELSDAALRLHHAGLLALPPGARLREQHRHPPDAADWVRLLDDYVRHALRPSGEPRDEEALAAIRRALPSIGHNLTRRGVRPGPSPVDRVLARSASKAHGAVEIAAAESAALGDRLRCLVLCDHERATARLPARLDGVLAQEAGSAWLLLETLAEDARTADLDPVLVTGRSVAAATAAAERFTAWLAERRPELRLAVEPAERPGLARVEGAWSSRTWVRLVTEYFEQGGTRLLVGTRGLLGEGWDAARVNTLVDLTTVTTLTSVVQTRGRALRLDPEWPEKSANVWTVVCVTDEHPKGAADWDRFVRKHDGYFAPGPDGTVAAGVAHVDAALSPFAPPLPAGFDAFNARMLVRAGDRDAVREQWRIGTGYADEPVRTLRIRVRRAAPAAPAVPAVRAGAPALPAAVLTPHGVRVGPALFDPRRPAAIEHYRHTPVPPPMMLPWLLAMAAIAAVLAGVAGGSAVLAPALGAPLAAGACAWQLDQRRRYRARVRRVDELRRRARAERRARAAELLDLAAEPGLARFAYAVADALKAAGHSSAGAEGVRLRLDADGTYQLSLAGAGPESSQVFAEALDEVVSPMAAPRYVMPRHVLTGTDEARRAALAAWLAGRPLPVGVVYHAVPTVLGRNRAGAGAFADAWRRWVSDGEPLYTGSPEGEGVLVTHRGEDPLQAETMLRLSWS